MKNDERVKLTNGALRRFTRIFKYVLPYKWKFSLGLLFLFLSVFTFMSFPGLLGRLIGGEDVSQSHIDQFFNLQNIDQVALLLVVVFALQAFFSFMRIYIFADVTERAIAQLRRDVFAKLITLPMTYFNRERTGELSSRISNDIGQLQETFMTTLAEFIRQSITIIFGVGLLFFYSVQLTLVMLVSLPVMMLAAFFFGRFIRTLSKKTQSELAKSQTVVEESLSGIQTVKAYANERFETLKYRNITESVRTVAMHGAKWRGAFASFIIFGLFGAIVLVIWYGVKLKSAGVIGIDELTSFILYTAFVGGSIGGIADVFGRIQKAVGATENLFDILDERQELNLFDDVTQRIDIQGQVEFNAVHFSYPSRRDMPVLKGIDFSIKMGQKVAIVGASGAGKSTIISLLFRFYDPVKGRILVDGKNIADLNLTNYRSQLALVPQEVLLFGGTIKENIEYGKPGASDAEIEQAASLANAIEFINGFPDGFETLVGERGIQLSGGQRQRIAIARAILKNPKILILDEATSSLDAENERLVQQAMDTLMKGRTGIIIAHRLSTVRKADKIFVIDGGSLVESGTHEELMQHHQGVYRNLSELQLSGNR